MYEIQNFQIISGRADMLLFFCSDYQAAVTAAINKIMEHVKYDRRIRLLTSLSCIELVESDGTRHFEMLRQYDDTEDLEEFVLGEITI